MGIPLEGGAGEGGHHSLEMTTGARRVATAAVEAIRTWAIGGLTEPARGSAQEIAWAAAAALARSSDRGCEEVVGDETVRPARQPAVCGS